MATIKEIDIVVNTDRAEKPTEKLTKTFDGLGKSADKTNKSTEKGLDNTSKSAKKADKSVGILSKGFKGLGTAIKAAGIGIVIAGIAALTSALSSNQKIMDGVNAVFETVSIVLSQVSQALVNVYTSVAKSSENFNGLQAVMKGLLTLAVAPLKLAFFGIKLAIQQSQLAWEKSFLGGNDKEKIKSLNLSIEETKDALSEVGEDAIKAGKDVVNNFSDMVSEVSTISTKIGDEVGKISIKSAREQAKINVQLKNSALLAAAQQQLLVEKYDILAEKQRQVRDEERNSIDDRIKANNELGEVLEMQEKAMIKAANLQVAAAQAEVNKNKTIESQVALTEALANRQGVLAQVEGFRSEQLVNDLGLKREQIELDNTISENEKERQLARLDFEAEIQLTEEGKNAKMQERLDLENEIIVADLERKRELFKEGTVARIEAEEEFLNADQIIKQKQRALDIKEAEDRIKIQENFESAKASVFNSGLNLISALAGKSKAIAKSMLLVQKGLAIAEVVTSASKSIAKASANLAATPAVIGVLPNPAYAVQAAATIKGITTTKLSAGAAIASILAQTISSAGGGGIGSQGGGSQRGGANAPSFNLVEGTQQNQLAQSINASNQRPMQAIVVASSVTNAQQANRNKYEESSI